MNELFDVQPYVRAPRLGARRGIVLCLRLILAAPTDLTGRTRAALEALRSACVTLQAIARERLRASPENVRRYDLPLDSGWIGLRMALEAVARLTGTSEADRATVILARALPNGTDFVRFPFEEEWAESENLLTRIAEEGLDTDIEALVGPAFLTFIGSAHAAFGEALGLGTTARELPDTTAVAEAVGNVAYAIAEYGRLMVGELDRGDPASVARFKTAMAPLDAYRASFARTGTEEDPLADEPEPVTDVDPEAPVPPIPSPTEA
jgi:hypothetical protein